MNKCRPIALILALLMLAMTACGVNRESDTTTTSSTSDPIADAATTPAETVPAETEAPLISGVPEI